MIIGLPQQNGQVVQLTPAKTANAQTEDSALTLGSETTVTFDSGTTFFQVHAPVYPVVFRYRGSGDSNAVTNAAGSYPYDERVEAGTVQMFAIPANVVSISLKPVTTDQNITIIEK